jgi:hypothetical protein
LLQYATRPQREHAESLGAFALPSVAKQLPQALPLAVAPFLSLLSAMLENATAAADKLITLVV